VRSANAGMLTILSNRVGDVAILLRISWLLNYGSWRFFYLQLMGGSGLGFILIIVILAAITRSAQIPFSAWLPAAIAAPTPVSALVHSSTLVTAGVYLIIRFNFLLGINSFLFYLGALTIFMSGLGANFEMDLKKNYCPFYFKTVRGYDICFVYRLCRTSFFSFAYTCTI